MEWRPEDIGVQVESAPVRSWFRGQSYLDAALDLFDGNGEVNPQHWQRRLPGYDYPSAINSDWGVYHTLFAELDRFRSRADGKAGFLIR